MSLSTFETFKHLSTAEGAIDLDGERLCQLQRVLALMLRDFDAACKKVGATYMLGGGSCLGAVREGGFIPWDDDLDLNMSRSDFELLAESFETLLGNRYVLQAPGLTKDYELSFPRLRRRGTTLRTRDDFGGGGEHGVYIDIFLIDSVPSNPILRAAHGVVSLGLGFVASCRRFAAHSAEYVKMAGSDSDAAKTFRTKARIGALFSFWTADRWAAIWDKWNGICRRGDSRYATIPVGRKHYFGELHRSDVFFPVSRGAFEGATAPLPHDCNTYLISLYGPDYMTPPPAKDREKHIVLEFGLGDCLNSNELNKGENHE